MPFSKKINKNFVSLNDSETIDQKLSRRAIITTTSRWSERCNVFEQFIHGWREHRDGVNGKKYGVLQFGDWKHIILNFTVFRRSTVDWL